MNKKSGRIVLTLILTIMVAVITINLLKDRGLFSSDGGLWNNQPSSGALTSRAGGSSPNGDNSDSSDNPDSTKTSAANNWSSVSGIADGMRFTVQQVEFSKEIGDLANPKREMFEMDTAGNMIGIYSYVKVTMTIENISAEKKDRSLTGTNLIVYHNGEPVEGNDYGYSSEAVTALASMGNSNSRSFMHFSLEPGQKGTYTAGYILRDEILMENNDIILYANPTGRGGGTIIKDQNGNVIQDNQEGKIATIRLNDFIVF